MEDSDSHNELLKTHFLQGRERSLPQRKLNLNIFERSQPERESPQAKRCIFKQEHQKFEAVLVISDDENENSTYQLKEDMIHLPEHPKQAFETEVRQE